MIVSRIIYGVRFLFGYALKNYNGTNKLRNYINHKFIYYKPDPLCNLIIFILFPTNLIK